VTTSGPRSALVPPGQYMVKRPGLSVAEVPREAGRDVLDLAEDAVAVEDLELRDRVRAVVGDLEGGRPRRDRSSAGLQPASVSVTSTERPPATFCLSPPPQPASASAVATVVATRRGCARSCRTPGGKRLRRTVAAESEADGQRT
jgi:hypothetical protein